jgi:hypothetical protein
MLHDVPGQQSALVEHAPQAETHALAKQVKGGVPPGLGTQGAPLQQSALEAQEPPELTQLEKAQRGTPRLSWRHVSAWQLPAQQSHVSLQDIVLSLQMSPFGLQPIGRRQTPTVAPALMTHVTGLPLGPFAIPAPPQQSSFLVQRSPTG